MNVIAHAGAVGRGVLVSEDFERLPLTVDGFESGRDEMSLRTVNLADRTRFVRSGSIEIAKADISQTVGRTVGLERLLENQFGYTVGIHGRTRHILGDRHFGGHSVNGATGRKHKLA